MAVVVQDNLEFLEVFFRRCEPAVPLRLRFPSLGRKIPAAPMTRSKKKRMILDVPRFLQPDDATCGPTCLLQVYRYFGIQKTEDEILRETRMHPTGGTIAVWLGISALQNGFDAVLTTYNLKVFDPTWARLSQAGLLNRIEARRKAIVGKRLPIVLEAYADFLRAGGRVRFRELTSDLLCAELDRGHPILTGLSATYLYRTARERDNEYDDIAGEAVGHFVVVCGHEDRGRRFVLRDPARLIPMSKTGKYSVASERLLNAILLGDTTYDANLLVLRPKRRRRR